MSLDVLYLCKDRAAFTRASMRCLLDNTDWALVDNFFVYDDGSSPREKKVVYEMVHGHDWSRSPGLKVQIRNTEFGSPVAIMNDYLGRSEADVFAKIDNDIIVPPAWLVVMLQVLKDSPDIGLLGMQAGMGHRPPPDWDGVYRAEPATHIGGVGLMRRRVFERFGTPVPNGRFGFTEWQHRNHPQPAWITPDLQLFALDFLPFEPWKSLSDAYKLVRIQRNWPIYDPEMNWYWDWWEGSKL